MSKKKYPRDVWSTAAIENRPGLRSCKACGFKFNKGDRSAVNDRQVNWFRGDDEVEAFCFPCAQAKTDKQRNNKTSQERG